MIPFSQVPNCQARLAGVPTTHHQSHFLRIRGRFCGPKRGRGSWRVGVGTMGYLSKDEKVRLRPVRLAVDTLRTAASGQTRERRVHRPMSRCPLGSK